MKNKIRCFIADDDDRDRKYMRLILNTSCKEIEIVDEGKDYDSTLKGLSKQNFDVAILDIQLQNSTIFEILNQINKISFKIIFVSAHRDFAIESYNYMAIGYLLKPFEPQLLRGYVDKIITQKNTEVNALNLIEIQKIYTKLNQEPKITIADSKETHIIKIKAVLYCVSDGNYTTIVRENMNDLVLSKNLKSIALKLNALEFFRIHRSHLINVNHIKTLIKDSGGYVVMADGKKLSIARGSKKKLYEHLKSF